MKPEYWTSILALAVIGMVVFDWLKFRRSNQSDGNPGPTQEALKRIEHNQEKQEGLLREVKESSTRQETLQEQIVQEVRMLRPGNPGRASLEDNGSTEES